jgi:hypothetical protein
LLVSVVVTTYDHEKFAAEVIESVVPNALPALGTLASQAAAYRAPRKTD